MGWHSSKWVGGGILALITACSGGGGGGGSDTSDSQAGSLVPPSISLGSGNDGPEITWADVVGAETYHLYWGGASGVTPATGSKVGDVSSPFSVADLSLAAGQTAYLVVTAATSSEESDPSNEEAVIGPLPAATNFSVTAGDSKNTLVWDEVVGASSYTLYWHTFPGVGPDFGTAVAGVTSPYSHTGLTNDQAYYYVVVAIDADGQAGVSSAEESGTPGSGGPSPYDPTWGSVSPSTTLSFDYDNGLTDQQNGANLKTAIQNLNPGQRLEISSGTYNINSKFDVALKGTSTQPIWIAAQEGATPVITRPNASQNIMNVNSNAEYVVFEGLEFTGGSAGIRIYNASNLWINRCHIHDTEEAALTANTADTDRLYITRNEIHDTGGFGEGMYLGANNGQYIMSNSVIALNHVYDTLGTTQGDGIEVKQGSYGNWIAENLVHDTNYPCILVYGTAGQPVNIIEKNICYNSNDNVMQVQGEAIVRNNLCMNGGNAFYSNDHQGTSRNLQVIHNTFINSGRAARLNNWANRTGQVFANNVCYSQNGEAMKFNGSGGTTITGNVKYGSVSGTNSGYVSGSGLSDFVNVSWDASSRNAVPSSGGSIINTGNPAYAESEDLTGNARSNPLEAGCYDEN